MTSATCANLSPWQGPPNPNPSPPGLYATLGTFKPTEKEVSILEGLLGKERKRLQANPKDAKALFSSASALKLSPGLDEVELAAWFFVANALLNLDETITKG